MTRIHRYTMEDVCSNLPEVEKFDQSGYCSNIDFFVSALGFEERCLKVPSLIGKLAKNTGIIHPGTNVEDNERNLTNLKALLSHSNVAPTSFDGESISVCSKFREWVSSDTISPHIALDLTVMPSRVMLPIVSAIMELGGALTVFYTMAKRYLPDKEDFEKNRAFYCSISDITTEEGVKCITPSVTHTGQHLDPLPACIVLFPNFRRERTRAVIASIDESLLDKSNEQLVWLLTKPFTNDFTWRLQATRIVNSIKESDKSFAVEAVDYRDTMSHLEMIYANYWKTHNISISPLGTKMQRFGAALFNFSRPSTRLVYANPRRYSPGKWSSGIGTVYSVTFPSIAQLRNELLKLGQLTVR